MVSDRDYTVSENGIVEQLYHAVRHSALKTDFDLRIAFISYDNAIELLVKSAFIKHPNYQLPSDSNLTRNNLKRFVETEMNDLYDEFNSLHVRRNLFYHQASESPNREELKRISQLFFTIDNRVSECGIEISFEEPESEDARFLFINKYEKMVEIFFKRLLDDPDFGGSLDILFSNFTIMWNLVKVEALEMYSETVIKAEGIWRALKNEKNQEKIDISEMAKITKEINEIINIILSLNDE